MGIPEVGARLHSDSPKMKKRVNVVARTLLLVANYENLSSRGDALTVSDEYARFGRGTLGR